MLHVLDSASHPFDMNTTIPNGKNGLIVLVTLASAVVVIAGLQAARDVIVPVVLASFLAVVSYPITHLLKTKCRFPHWLAVTVTVFADFGFLTGLVFLMNYLTSSVTTVFLGKYNTMFQQKYGELVAFLKENGWDGEAQRLMSGLQELLSGQRMMELTTSLMSRAASMITVTTIVLILMTFFLGEAPLFKRNLAKLSSEEDSGLGKFTNAVIGIQKYLIIKTLISFITGVLAWALCLAVGVDLPLFWAILAFILNFIPTFGSIVAAIPPMLLAWLMQGSSEMVVIGIGYLAINVTLGNLVEPMLMGRQFGIATCVVLLSVIFWGWIWGPIGMLLAVPISMLVKLALESSKDLRWIAQLIDDPPQKKIPLLPEKSSSSSPES